MLHQIKHRFTAAVLFEAEIDCAADTRDGIKLGLAVRVAVKADANLAGANLAGAYLARADLAGAYLADANLAGAYLARADLAGANLAGAYLADANLADADLAGANLARASLAGAYLADANLADANLARADLAGAYLARADLAGANLAGAYLADANLIDCGQDRRGYRFWCWRHKDGHVVYRAGCREWSGIEAARAHYGDDYDSDGDRAECLARLDFMHGEATRRGWLNETQAAA